MRKAIHAQGASSVGPYSHGIDAEGLLFLSGQTPIDEKTGKLLDASVGQRTQKCLANLFQVLKEAGMGPEDVQKVNVYLTDMADFEAMNEAYRQMFKAPYPARTTIGVQALPLGSNVEIELIARRK